MPFYHPRLIPPPLLPPTGREEVGAGSSLKKPSQAHACLFSDREKSISLATGPLLWALPVLEGSQSYLTISSPGSCSLGTGSGILLSPSAKKAIVVSP